MPNQTPNSEVILAERAQLCPVCGSLTFNPLCPECVEVVQQRLLLSTFHQASAGRPC